MKNKVEVKFKTDKKEIKDKDVLNQDVTTEFDGNILKKVRIDQVFSEKRGKFVSEFYYKILKESRLSYDYDAGEHCDTYSKVFVEHIDEFDYKYVHEVINVVDIAKEIGCNTKLVIPITKEEYMANTGFTEDDLRLDREKFIKQNNN